MNESGGGGGLEIGLRWAPARPVQRSVPRSVSFAADTIPLIQEAARIFRRTPPKEGFEIEGYVTTLTRKEEVGGKGTVSIATFVEDSPRVVNVRLEGDDYDRALDAHKYGIKVICYGKLIKQGGQFVLIDNHGFTLEAD